MQIASIYRRPVQFKKIVRPVAEPPFTTSKIPSPIFIERTEHQNNSPDTGQGTTTSPQTQQEGTKQKTKGNEIIKRQSTTPPINKIKTTSRSRLPSFFANNENDLGKDILLSLASLDLNSDLPSASIPTTNLPTFKRETSTVRNFMMDDIRPTYIPPRNTVNPPPTPPQISNPLLDPNFRPISKKTKPEIQKASSFFPGKTNTNNNNNTASKLRHSSSLFILFVTLILILDGPFTAFFS